METQETERNDVMNKTREEVFQKRITGHKIRMKGCGFLGLSKGKYAISSRQQRRIASVTNCKQFHWLDTGKYKCYDGDTEIKLVLDPVSNQAGNAC